MLSQSLAALIRVFIDGSTLAIPATVARAFHGTGLPAFFGIDGSDFGRRLRRRPRSIIRQTLHFEHDVFFERFLDLCAQVHDR